MNDVGAVIGYIVGIVGLLFTASNFIYNRTKDAKKDGKECASDMTRVLVKLDTLQQSMNSMNEKQTSMQTKFEGFDHRLTVVETKLALGVVNAKSLND
jgi:hypothetical protein